jgi:ubiquinone/menaquinone biosynthesis C-methylase UbiE
MEKISRVTRTKNEARTAYDAMSRWYDWLAGSSERSFRGECLGLLAVQAGETVLEIGFGTGEALVDLARSVGESGRVYGIDLSEGMRQRALSRLEGAGLSDRVEMKTGDAAALPYASGMMDAVFTAFTLELFDTPEIPAIVAECRRVLKHGGRMGVVAMTKPETNNLMVALYEWAHRAFPSWIDCRPIPSRFFLEGGGFKLRKRTVRSMWGLPVEVILAQASEECDAIMELR